jgi:tetratricopeptide (TPR) repeat protein
VIRRPAYAALLRKRSFPEAARNFLAWAMIQEANAEDLGAGWSALHAAWACDDAGKTAAARACRQQALVHFEQARKGGKPLPGFEDAGAKEIFLADLYRRTGQFEQAVAICRKGLDKHPTPVVARTLEHEIILAAGSDEAAHSLSEVVGLVPGLMN